MEMSSQPLTLSQSAAAYTGKPRDDLLLLLTKGYDRTVQELKDQVQTLQRAFLTVQETIVGLAEARRKGVSPVRIALTSG